MPRRHAFITGSHAYGEPNKDSDVDLVVRCSPKVKNLLLKNFDPPSSHLGCSDPGSIVVGGLNLILCETDREYDNWKRGTRELKKAAPVSREKAVAHFAKIRAGL